MKIKKIEICGFKSFSDKIGIEFPPGVTGVVGPNGCGKSNVVDAIRWVLGEQSPKQLRGKTMEDVIFNGSENRKPMGMAEVTLFFNNENGHPIADYLDFTEISVSRRLFRSGESEYFINNVPSRLKDITDLFLGTGVGHRAYSIVEQGKMDFVLNAKPDERRILIEEAAGVTRYKDRKAAALRKMEATQQNLLRLGDVIGEIKRQMNSLNRQAKKAERFKEYRQELRTLEFGQAAQTCRALDAQRREMESSLQELQNSEIGALAEIRDLEAQVEAFKISLLEGERDLAEHQEVLARKEGEIKNRETQIELSTHEGESLKKQALRAEEEIRKLGAEKEDLGKEVVALEKGLTELSARIAEETLVLARKEDGLREKRSATQDAERALALEKDEMVDLLSRRAQLQNQRTDLQRRIEEGSRLLGKMAREKEEAEQKASEIRALLIHQSQQLGDHRDVLSQIAAEREQKLAQAEELQSSLAALKATIEKAREELHLRRSRLDSLLELQRNFEGYQEGVRAILRKCQAQGSGSNGVCGLVEDILETDPQYEAVVEAVLGERLQNVIVRNHGEGLKAIEYLKTQKSGRSSFIPLHLKSSPVSPAVPPREGVIPLLDVVRVKEEFSPLAAHLLGDAWIVPDLPRAIELWNADSLWQTLVTPEGEVLHPSGVVTGGSKEQAGSGTFRRKREIRELHGITEELTRRLRGHESDQEQLSSSAKSLENSIAGLTQAFHNEELRIVRESKELDQNDAELKRWNEKIETVKYEEIQLKEEQEQFHEQIGENQIARESLETIHQQKEEALARLEEDLQRRKTEIEALSAEVTEAKVSQGALQEKKQSVTQNLERARRSWQETESLLGRRREEIADHQRQILAAEEQRSSAEETLRTLLAERLEYQSQLQGKKEALLAEREKLTQEEQLWKEKRESLHSLQERKNGVSMKSMELDLQVKHLLANIEEKHHIGAEGVFTPADEQDYFSPPMEERRNELKALIEAMGEVNLLAIQEYEEAKARLEFLTGQESDLIHSLAALDQAIKKINRTTRQRFAQTFAAVNEKFKEIFATLFNGGSAELVLLDESNLLETGVDISARPPGKKLQNVNLLSGGEKALTAVALIFSLFLINPSPFCLMDEVDAPLDDANIGRFNRLIKELSAKYQIILVTHNKNTMELADTLYGVTMEDPGISKLISVRLN